MFVVQKCYQKLHILKVSVYYKYDSVGQDNCANIFQILMLTKTVFCHLKCYLSIFFTSVEQGTYNQKSVITYQR